MFWNKWFNKIDLVMLQKFRLKTPPIDLPPQVWRHLVVNLGKDLDWVWNLKAVVKPIEGRKKTVRRFRVFDPAIPVKLGIKIIDYDSLDAYPEMILYEGDYDKGSTAVSLSAFKPARLLERGGKL